MLIKKNRIPLIQMLLLGFLPSPVKIMIYRMMGYRIASGVKIGLGTVFLGKRVAIGNQTRIGHFSIIRAKDIFIGTHCVFGSFCFWDTEKISIGNDTRINEQVHVGGLTLPESEIVIGDRCLIMQMTNINPTMPIHIGDDTAIGGHSLLFTHSSWLSVLDGAPAKFEPITIGQRVWIPWRTFITSGVSIGDDVIIGPDSLINRNIPARSMAHGNPMKIVPNIFLRKPSPEKRTEILSNIINEFIAYLKHNKITAVLDKSLLQISGNGKQSQIQFCLNLETPLSGKVDLRVDDAAPEYLEERVLGSNCYINLNSRQRIGTSPAAEEFIRFLSRYGIRFHRLDE